MKKVWEGIKKRKWIVVALVGIALIGWVWWSRTAGAKKQVVTAKPEIRDIVESLDVSGNVDAHERADLRFAAASKLTWLPIKEGDRVKKWQAIAAVDSRQLQKQLQIDQNLHGIQFRTTEGVFDTNKIYGEQGLTETQRRTVESSQLSLRNTALTVEYQDIAIKNSTMISPIEGIVTKIDQPNVGALALPTDVFQIVNPRSVYFSVVVDEADVGKVNASQSAEITLDAFPESQLNATVERIAFTPSQSQSGGLGYKVSLNLPIDNSAQQYRLGMSGDAKIILEKKVGVLSVLTDAITERNGEKSVEVMKNGLTQKTTIQTGISDGDYTEILSGVTIDDVIVIPTSGTK